MRPAATPRAWLLDLSAPREIAPALAGIETLDGLVLAAIERDLNTVADYGIDRALRPARPAPRDHSQSASGVAAVSRPSATAAYLLPPSAWRNSPAST
jgi:hypothetical protein